MSAQVFSKKDVLGHGFYQTQKYIGFILLLGLVVLIIKTGVGTLGHFAGQGQVTKDPRPALDLDNAQANLLMKSLISEDYISEQLYVRDRLRYLDTPMELQLPPEFASRREDIFEFLTPYRYRLPFPMAVYRVLQFFFLGLDMLMAIGYIKIFLAMSRDKKPQLSDLFVHVDLLFSYAVATICYVLMLLGGGLLLIVPGFIFGVMFQMYTYGVADKGLGPIAALKNSREITRGSRLNLFWLGCLVGLINLAGLLCFVVGLLWSIPTTAIALATVYDKLEAAGGTGNLEDLVRQI